MNTYKNLRTLITLGRKSREEILTMMDIFLMNERITETQYNELIDLMDEVGLE